MTSYAHTRTSLPVLSAALAVWALAAGLAAADPNTPAAPADPNATVVSADPNAPVAPADPNAKAPAAPAKPAKPLQLLDSKPGLLSGRGGTKEMLLRTVGAAAVVLVLGGVVAVVAKKVLPRIQAPGGKKVRVLETTYLGPRKTVHLLAVGGKQYLVASTRDRVSLLADVSADFADKLDSALKADQEEQA